MINPTEHVTNQPTKYVNNWNLILNGQLIVHEQEKMNLRF
jgi:hypothetical protein